MRDIVESFLKSTCFKVFYFLLMIIFLVAVIGYGSSPNESAKNTFMIIEEVCQGLFLVRLVLKLIVLERSEIIWNLLDFLTIASAFIGHNISNDETGKYLLAIRALKLIFMIKEVQEPNEEVGRFMSSFKKASYILVPALILIYIYAIIGLYSFLGIQFLT